MIKKTLYISISMASALYSRYFSFKQSNIMKTVNNFAE